MQEVKFENVIKSYNGKVGCMCGCLGRYTIPEHVSIEAANKETGWSAYSEEDVSNRRVKIAINKVNKVLAMSEEERKDKGIELFTSFEGNCKYVSIEDGMRNTTVYLK